MKIHEYQAKEVFARFDIPVPSGGVATTPEEAEKIARDLKSDVVVLKAQVHAGGRGKAGGIKVVNDLDRVGEEAASLLGRRLVTHQTDEEGQPIHKLLVEQGVDIARELYVAITLDRSAGMPVLMASAEGGVEIEKVAAETPEKIFKERCHPGYGLQPYQGRRLAKALGLGGKLTRQAVKLFQSLDRLYRDIDASLAEMNPLIVTGDDRLMALDGKINLDDNALYRHPDLAEYRDPEQEDAREAEAKEYGLSYIGLDGNIGCMVNGAGLAMATMDTIKHYGGEPANFLDVGGGADREKVAKAFEIILRDENVKAILVNIFGGIMQCDIIAQGVIDAVKQVHLEVPLVVRLEGTNVDEGRRILEESGLPIIRAAGMREAGEKVVEAANS